MCGIAGIISFDGSPPDLHALRRMTDAMRHRGPDDEGIAAFERGDDPPSIWAGPATPEGVFRDRAAGAPASRRTLPPHAGRAAAFGHRRLAIVDLSAAGHQPMATEDGRYWIIHNGEVYNFREVRRELAASGERFRSDTDTEVILKAYRRWGPSCLDRFNGMWAFAIWDDATKTVFCARDRIGIKPFHFVHDERRLVFASDVKTLIASGLYTPEVDVEGLYHALTFTCAPRPLTCFRSVRALEAAHWMTVDLDGHVERTRYWSVPLGEVDERRSDESWEDALEETLTRAVRRRLVADVPVAAYMSGGIDSTTIAAIAADARPGFRAYTLTLPAGDDDAARLDELPQARATAQRHGMDHVVHAVTVDEALDAMRDVVRVYEEPGFPFSPNYLVSRVAAQHGTRVVLAGLGPDELFCGYGRERLARAWEGMPWWRRRLGRCMPRLGARRPHVRRLARFDTYADCYVSAFSAFDEDEKRRLFDPRLGAPSSASVLEHLYAPRDAAPFRDGVEAFCFYELHAYIGNDHVYREDQCAMRFSLESRFPYLDHELVELAFRMPARMKIRGRESKYVLRRVARRHIDPASLAMGKKGFTLPMASWVRGPLRSVADEAIAALRSRGLLRCAAIDRIARGAAVNDRAALQMSVLVAVELWLQTFFDARTVPEVTHA